MTATAVDLGTAEPVRLRWPALATFGVVAFAFSRVSESIEATTSIGPVSSILALLAVLAAVWSRVERWQPRPMLAVTAAISAAYLAVMAFSGVGARDPSLSLQAIAGQLASIVICIAVVVLVTTPRRLELALSAVVAATLVVSSVNCFQAITGSYESDYLGLARSEFAALDTEEGWRLGGPVGDPNFFAQVLVVGVVVSATRVIAARRSDQRGRMALAATLTGTVALLLTYSRGGLLAFGAAMLLLSFRWLRWRAVVGAVIAVFVLVLVAPDALVSRVGTAAAAGPEALDGEVVADGALNGRASEAIVGYEQFGDHWFLGVGVGNYEVHYLEYAEDLGLDGRGVERSAHSLIVETMAETGIVGLGMLAVIVFLAFAAIRSLRERSATTDNSLWWCAVALEAGLVAHLTCALFLHSTYPRGFWLLLGLAFACGQVRPAAVSTGELTESW